MGYFFVHFINVYRYHLGNIGQNNLINISMYYNNDYLLQVLNFCIEKTLLLVVVFILILI